MSKTKTHAEAKQSKAPASTLQKQPETPEKMIGPSLAGTSTTAAMPPPNGKPSAARAADLMTAPEMGSGASGRARMMTAMQGSVGNARLSRMLGPTVRTKLTVGAPNDTYEQEADRMADTVMRMPEPRLASAPSISRQQGAAGGAGLCPECKEKLQRQVEAEEEPGGGSASLRRAISKVQLCPACMRTVRRQVDAGSNTDYGSPEGETASPGMSEEYIQRQAEENGVPAVTPETETYLKSTQGGGRPLPAGTRQSAEAHLDRDFGDVRVHDDAAANEAVKSLKARAFTHGSDVYLAANESAGDRRLMGHELTHVVQQGGDLKNKLIQRNGSLWESPPDSDERRIRECRDRSNWSDGGHWIGSGPEPNCADAGVPGIALRQELESIGEAYWEQVRARHKSWESSHRERSGEELGTQVTTLSAEIEQTERALDANRVAMFRQAVAAQSMWGQILGFIGIEAKVNIPTDLLGLWAAANQQVIVVKSLATTAEIPLQNQTDAALALVQFYSVLLPTLKRIEEMQQARQNRERALFDAERQRRSEMRQRMREMTPYEPGAGAAFAGMAISDNIIDRQREQELYRAPEPSSPMVQVALAQVQSAITPADWRTAASHFKSATRSFDALLRYYLPWSTEARTSEYQTGLLQRQEKLRTTHPEARKIPAVFYPEDEFTKGEGEEGVPTEVAQGIPWQFYLYTEGLQTVGGTAVAGSGGKWVLKDLTNPKAPENRADVSDRDAALLPQGWVPDPPWTLFEELDSKYRFSKGALYVQLPSGKQRRMDITNSWGWTEWLTAIATALGITAAILFTAGAATPVVLGVGAASAAAGIGATLSDVEEKKRHGLLTEGDVSRASLFIAADLASIATFGLGKVATISVQGARLARLTALTGRLAIGVGRAGRVLDAASILVASHDLVKAYQAIKDPNNGMTETDRERAFAQLTHSALLLGTLTAVPAVVGRNSRFRPDQPIHIIGESADGRVILSQDPRLVRAQGAETGVQAGEGVTGRATRETQLPDTIIDVNGQVYHRRSDGTYGGRPQLPSGEVIGPSPMVPPRTGSPGAATSPTARNRTAADLRRQHADLEDVLDQLKSYPEVERMMDALDSADDLIRRGDLEGADNLLEILQGRVRLAQYATAEGVVTSRYGGPAEGRLTEFTPTTPTGRGRPIRLDESVAAPSDATGQRLLEHVQDSIVRFETEGFTAPQERALQLHPELEPAFRGSRIDEFAKQAVLRDPELQHVLITRNYERGADFYDARTGLWYDITTTGAWKKHVEKYGPLGFRLPTEPAP